MIKRTYFMSLYLAGQEGQPKHASGMCVAKSWIAKPAKVHAKMHKEMVEWLEQQGFKYEKTCVISFNRLT